MKLILLSFLVLLSEQVLAKNCVKEIIVIDEKEYPTCKIGKFNFISRSCKSLSKCFPTDKSKIEFMPNQNPSYTLCLNMKGTPTKGIVQSSQSYEDFCLLNEQIVDLGQLIGTIK